MFKCHALQRWVGLCGLTAGVLAVPPCFGHGVVGARFFPATLTIDDPFVADELSLPTISTLKTSDDPLIRDTDYSIDVSKRLSPNLGISLSGTYKRLKSDEGDSREGLDNFASAVTYVFAKSEAHEALSSFKIDWDMGGTGNSAIGDKFSTFTPSILFGKGLGDLSNSLNVIRPLAITGIFGVALPAHHTDEDDVVIPRIAKWGFTVQYNLQYLQSNVKDIGLKEPFSRLIPVVELPLQTPLEGDTHGQTTGTVNPGLIWFGRYIQLGLEAQLPINAASGHGVGVIGQLHFYLDDIAPHLFTWTPFHGILGPTQTN